MDCSLVRYATGRACSNLRELLEAIRTVPDAVLEHHMMHCALEDHFELHEFPNDLARWCWTVWGITFWGNKWGWWTLTGNRQRPRLRAALVNLIEDRLWGLDHVPWCRPGLELHLVGSHLIAYDTGERVDTPAALLEAIERMSLRSLFYHVHDARRRTAGQSDDFSLWLEKCGADASLVAAIAGNRLLLPEPEPTSPGAGGGVPALRRRSSARAEERPMRLLDRYEEIVGHQEVERLRRLAERLAGKRIVHVNSTRIGGGVAEILGWMVPLLEELGIDARWEVITGPPDFYRVTKAFHNGVAGPAGVAQEERFRSALRGQSGKRPAAEPGGGHRVRA